MMGCFGIRPLVVSMVACVGIAVSANRQAIEPCEVQTLTSGAPPFSDAFGARLAVDGDTLVVTALSDSRVGAVYVYGRDGGIWTLEQTLSPSMPGSVEQGFGFSVDIDGEVMAIGAPGISLENASQIGEAYIFRRIAGIWAEEARLLPSDSSEGDRFGYAVALSGERMAVSAGQDPRREEHRGWVYVFEWNGSSWVEQARLQGSDSAAADQFGFALDLQGDTLLIGAPRHDSADPADPDCNSGAVYLFEHNGAGWIEEDKLLPSDLGCPRVFGEAIALDGTTVVIGASGNFGGAGSAYVFTSNHSAWQQQARLRASDGEPPDHFGKAVAMDDDWIVVGSPEDNTGGTFDTGSAYLYITNDASVWHESYHFVPPPLNSQQNFGAGVAILGHVIGIGAAAVSQTHIYSFVTALPCIPAASTLGLATMAIVTVVAGGLLLRRRGARDARNSSLGKEEDDDPTTGSDRGDWSWPPPERLTLRRPIIPRASWSGSRPVRRTRERRRLMPPRAVRARFASFGW